MDPAFPDETVIHHSTMLGDAHRLKIYDEAIRRVVRTGDHVADLGCGMGILSYFASRAGACVTGIEFLSMPYEVASTALAQVDNVRLINKPSFHVHLEQPVNVLVTETMGQVGPEEHIVEATCDFVERHPGIRSVVPAALTIGAVPITSREAKSNLDDALAHFRAIDRENYRLSAAEPLLRRSFCSIAFHRPLNDADIAGENVVLAQYRLGASRSSRFDSTLEIPANSACDAIHLYFVAQLVDELYISTRFDEPLSHWSHTYVLRPPGATRLRVSYTPPSRHVTTSWIEP